MIPVTLRTERLVLDQPTSADVDLIAEFCNDPLFEQYLTTPWPYDRKHAVHFVEQSVPSGWRTDDEYTWAIRRDGRFAGMVGYRTGLKMIGFWLGAPHRGHGLMTEAAGAVVDWVFSQGLSTVLWECVVGNEASVSVARKLGFTFTGARPSALTDRDGSYPESWHATLNATDDRSEKPGWPTA